MSKIVTVYGKLEILIIVTSVFDFLGTKYDRLQRLKDYNKKENTMKSSKILIALSLFMVVTNGLWAAEKRYQIKSGIIEYKLEGDGNVMGFRNKTTGTKKLIFKDWGNIELDEDKKIILAGNKENKKHSISKFDNGKTYMVDFKHQIIIQQNSEIMGMMANKYNYNSGKNMMKSMGGEKLGKDTILGYKCDVWDIMGAKTCMYKGIPLKTETNMMGINFTITATKIEFNIEIPNKEFELPNFPVKTRKQMVQDMMNSKMP